MKLSRFNQFVENYPEIDQILIHNTLSGSFVVMQNGEFDSLREISHASEESDSLTQLINKYQLDDTDVGVCVRSWADEDQEFLDWFERRRAQVEVMEVTVGLNLACNFDCPYCCQAEVMSGSVMSHETIDTSARWIAERALRQEVELVHLVFVGGEPMLHPDRLLSFAKQVQEKLSGSSVAFSFSLLTNGYFLSPEIVQRLLPYGLNKAQVTLDGDESTHQITRVSKKKENTFTRIFDNVISASQYIEIAINGNYQHNTIHGFLPLLEKLQAAGLTPGSSVKFSPALQATGSNDYAGLSATWADSSVEFQIALHDEIIGHGFSCPSPNEIGPCEFHEHHSFAVGHDGTIYKCPGFLGHPDWNIGDVSSGLTGTYEKMIEATPQSGCNGCSQRPNCGGGCVAEAMLKSGECSGVSCEKEFFDRNVSDSLIRAYRDAQGLSPIDPMRRARSKLPKTPMKPALPIVQHGRRPAALRIL